MELVPLFIIVAVLVIASGICSGLNISLMALDPADLRRKARSGNNLAKLILPLRRNSHLTLASILLVNVAVVSATSLVLGDRYSGLVAGLATTLLVVIFGEIVPQALFVRNALTIVGYFVPLMRLMIIFTYPVSKPLQLVLDKLFKHGPSQLHSRQELGLLISEHARSASTELDEDEIVIMRSALELSEKRVLSIMTPLTQVYWMKPTDVIDAAKIDEIKLENWSRIPILTKDRSDCLGILLMKDLVDIDFDERPFAISELPLHSTKIIGSRTALDTLFRQFIGARSHLMPVERNDKIIGIVTIEDLIEEILGHEIEDESDTSGIGKGRGQKLPIKRNDGGLLT